MVAVQLYEAAEAFFYFFHLVKKSLHVAKVLKNLQGSTYGTCYYVLIANKTFKDGKYAFSIRTDNVFMPFQTIRESNTSNDFDLLTDTKLIRRFIRISFNYRFGARVGYYNASVAMVWFIIW